MRKKALRMQLLGRWKSKDLTGTTPSQTNASIIVYYTIKDEKDYGLLRLVTGQEEQ